MPHKWTTRQDNLSFWTTRPPPQQQPPRIQAIMDNNNNNNNRKSKQSFLLQRSDKVRMCVQTSTTTGFSLTRKDRLCSCAILCTVVVAPNRGRSRCRRLRQTPRRQRSCTICPTSTTSTSTTTTTTTTSPSRGTKRPRKGAITAHFATNQRNPQIAAQRWGHCSQGDQILYIVRGCQLHQHSQAASIAGVRRAAETDSPAATDWPWVHGTSGCQGCAPCSGPERRGIRSGSPCSVATTTATTKMCTAPIPPCNSVTNTGFRSAHRFVVIVIVVHCGDCTDTNTSERVGVQVLV